MPNAVMQFAQPTKNMRVLPIPAAIFMLVIASSCGLMRVHAALINPHFFKNGDVSIPSWYEKQTPRKIPNEINGLLADFDGKSFSVPDYLNGLYLS
jgi:hypothetical protein